nr:immunoglobulin heavy chain junction region [Macaca mulatta]MOW46542.1 immunoglobulin heavy chain junction region [Macaca mulatta]MOW47646.1 immunoglobulin heavy chain junction region [Macaca mulatta]MOW48614.1 immunoglobulin heavy chain junction region [Macaca mulatta]MOW48945.1 immunoglobulin heavy chain junction region [Macaca mulatta]
CARASYDQYYDSGYFQYNHFDVW